MSFERDGDGKSMSISFSGRYSRGNSEELRYRSLSSLSIRSDIIRFHNLQINICSELVPGATLGFPDSSKSVRWRMTATTR